MPCAPASYSNNSLFYLPFCLCIVFCLTPPAPRTANPPPPYPGLSGIGRSALSPALSPTCFAAPPSPRALDLDADASGLNHSLLPPWPSSRTPPLILPLPLLPHAHAPRLSDF